MARFLSLNCLIAIIKIILKLAPEKKTTIKGVGELTKKQVAQAPMITAIIFEHVPIAALAVPAMCPIGAKAKVLTLLKRNPKAANAGTENIKKPTNSNSVITIEMQRKRALQIQTHKKAQETITCKLIFETNREFISAEPPMIIAVPAKQNGNLSPTR